MLRNARVPPQSLEAEQATLGACLLSGPAIDRALQVLDPEDFYREAHKRVFEAAVGLRRRLEPVDLTTLAADLESRGQLEQAGGRPYLASLLEAVPTAAHVDYYAAIVEQKAKLRRLIGVGTEIVEACYGDVEDADEAASRAEAAVRAARGRDRRKSMWTSAEVMDAAYGEIAESREAAESRGGEERGVNGVPTGLSDLDAQTNGFQRGDLVVVGGERSNGKTALALQTATYAAKKRGIVSLVCTLEMTVEGLGKRQIQTEGRVDSRILRSGCYGPEEAEKIALAIGRLTDLPIHIEDGLPMSPMRLLAKARAIEGLGLVVVDYLQKLRPDGRHDSERQGLEANVQALKQMALELKVPVLVVSSLSREGKLRESGQIDYEADVILRLSRNKKREEEQRTHWAVEPGAPEQWAMDVVIDKQRNGWVGTVEAGFIAPWAQWVCVARR